MKYVCPEIIDRRIAKDLLAVRMMEAGPKLYAKLSITPPMPVANDCVKNIGLVSNLSAFSFVFILASITKLMMRISCI